MDPTTTNAFFFKNKAAAIPRNKNKAYGVQKLAIAEAGDLFPFKKKQKLVIGNSVRTTYHGLM